MAVTITRETSGNAEVIVASDQLTGNDFAAVSVDIVVDYTAVLERIATALEQINIKMNSLSLGGGGGLFSDVAMYKLFIEQGGILDASKNVDGETMVKAISALHEYRTKVTNLNV